MAHYEKTISESTVFSGKIFQVINAQVELEDGNTSHREIVRHPGGAAIVPLSDNREVYLVRQFRYAFGRELLEIPAGKLEPGEDPKAAAIRELREECGLTAGKVTDLMPIYPTVGYDSEVIHMYLATDLSVGEAEPDPGEFVDLIKMPLTQAIEMVMSGEIQDGKTVAALLKTNQLLEGWI